MTDADILNLAKLYANHKGLEISTLGKYIADDGQFFKRLEAGKTITLRRANTVLKYFTEDWPDDLAWPSDIPRPQPAPQKRKVA